MEAGMWLYPWDFLDGGAPVLDEFVAMGVTAVHLTASYHSVLALTPHNLRRRTFLAERGAIYFQPDQAHWAHAPLQPLVSPFVHEHGDALAVAAPLCRERGLQLVAWTVCLHNSDLAFRSPEANVVNLRGEAYRFALCAAHPAVRAYLRTLMRDLRQRVDAIELELPHWLPFPHHHHAKPPTLPPAAHLALNLCFCPHCRKRYEAHGADPDQIAAQLNARLDQLLEEAHAVDALIDAVPALNTLLAAREETITSLVAELVAAAAPTPIYAMPLGDPRLTGVNAAALAATAARLEVLAYGAPEAAGTAAREALGLTPTPDRLTIGLSLLAPETPDEAHLQAALQAVHMAGVQRVCLYNYGLASQTRLAWAARSLQSLR
jgi:hypothetical protein